MAIDTPARLAILGAGPIGLEAALYARFLGYDVVVYEQGGVAEAVRRQGSERLTAPFSAQCSSLGLAAIEAQDENYRPPPADAELTGNEWRERYLLPLSQTDLVSDHLRLHTTVISVSQADDDGWSVVSRDASDLECGERFDGILDCTGFDSALSKQPPGENYHILGSKTVVAGTHLEFAAGLTQIRRTFAILGDRAGLDLYAGATRLLR